MKFLNFGAFNLTHQDKLLYTYHNNDAPIMIYSTFGHYTLASIPTIVEQLGQKIPLFKSKEIQMKTIKSVLCALLLISVMFTLQAEEAEDTTPPEVEINLKDDFYNINTEGDFYVDFTEIVSGFELSDITISGTATVTLISMDVDFPSYHEDGITFLVVFSPTSPGYLIFNIADDVAKDAAGNGNIGGESRMNMNIGSGKPVPTITTEVWGDQTSPFYINVEFSQPVQRFEVSFDGESRDLLFDDDLAQAVLMSTTPRASYSEMHSHYSNAYFTDYRVKVWAKEGATSIDFSVSAEAARASSRSTLSLRV